MRLIDADALKEKRYRMHSEFLGTVSVVAVRDIDEAATIDVVPVAYGRWENGVCTYCDFDLRCLTDGENDLEKWVWDEGFDFCPNCGAMMDLED